jgi:hypothetical protein
MVVHTIVSAAAWDIAPFYSYAARCGFFGRTGWVMACSIGQPLRIRTNSVVGCIPTISAHSVTGLETPRNVTKRFVRTLRLCCLSVAQRQFSGEYGPLLSIRSKE